MDYESDVNNEVDQSGGVDEVSSEAEDMLSWTVEEIREGQRRDNDISYVIVLMEKNEEKPMWKEVELQSSEVKSLYNEWERLTICEGILFRKWQSVDGSSHRRQVVLPREYRVKFVQMAHGGMTGGHLGKAKTEEQVKRRAYWPGWQEDVALELRKCAECARYHRGKEPHQTPLQPFAAGEPFEVISIDITGKHPRSSRGNEYIITVIDLFSKFAEAYQ